MSDNGIIKALETALAIGDEPIGEHWGCFLTTATVKNALDLINRQKAGIDRFADIGKMYSESRAEAIKEFAERLKDAFPEGNRDAKCPAIYFDDYCEIIDDLVNVMTEETE